jgi:hypothetical protein
MRAADGSEACDLYKSRQGRQRPGAGCEVPAMLEHGFVLVDDA